MNDTHTQAVFTADCWFSFWAAICKTVCPMLSDHCPVLSVMLVYCGQTVGWIKMKLGTEVGLGPGHIVLVGDPAPPEKRGTVPPIFAPCLLWPNGCPSQLLMSTCTPCQRLWINSNDFVE